MDRTIRRRPSSIVLVALVLPMLLRGLPALEAASPKGGELGFLSSQLAVEKRLLGRDLEQLSRAASSSARAAERVARLAAELKDALRSDDVDPFSLDERESALREADATRRALDEELREIRGRIVERRQRMALLQEEISKRREEAQKSGDMLTGTWDVIAYPGPVKGMFELGLDGTLVAGEYAFDGNWRGSLRGNLAGDRVRLERWDAELGFSAIYYGRVSVADKSIKGTWEATDVSGGKPASGTWVARRREEPSQ